jgi:hypothetical protein
VADPAKLPKEELEKMRDTGAIMYGLGYIRLMARELGVTEADSLEGSQLMFYQMIEPMNIAMEAIWRALMEDHIGKEEALIRFRKALLNV